MNEEPKHTEDHNASRSEMIETQSQESMRNLHKGEHESVQNLRGKSNFIKLKGTEYEPKYLKMEDPDSKQKYPPPMGLQASRVGSEISHLNDVEKTYDCMYKGAHDQIVLFGDLNSLQEEYPDDEEEKVPYRAHTDGNYDYSVDNRLDSTEKEETKKPTVKLGSISMKTHLPQLKLNVPLALTTNEVFEIFVNVSKRQSFQVIEMEQTIATAVNKEPFSFKRMFMRCIPFSDMRRDQPNDSFISAIRLQLSINDVKACRKICLKGLYGENQRLQDFVNAFKQRVRDKVEQLPSTSRKSLSGRQPGISTVMQGHRKKSSTFKSLTQMSKQTMRANDSDEDEGEQKHGAYNETSSLYQIHKILSSENYSLGHNVAMYIESFHLQYKSLRESSELLPQPTEGIMSIVDETVHAFNSEYNLGKESAKSLIHYCRPAVEKYVFSKLYDKLFAMYAIKNEEEDRLFNERSAHIKKMKPSDIMNYLGIKEKFIINEPLNFSSRISYMTENPNKNGPQRSDSDSLFKPVDQSLNFESQRSEQPNQEHHIILQNTSTTSSMHIGGMVTQPHKHDQPYSEAIKCIEKIQQFTSPREKLACLSESFGCMKTAIVDYWKGKVELNTMDDVLPLTIYAVAMANLSHPASEFNLLEDFLRIHDKGFDFERKLLTNFDGSIRYINHEWEIEHQ